MALFIMATLLPERFGRICRVISGLAWKFVATGWQRLPLPKLPARQRPRAPTVQRRPTGPGPLERFVAPVVQETLAWVHEKDLVGHMVGLSVALLLALHILSFYLGEGVLVLKRASQRVADGRWTPLLNRFRRPLPVGGRKAMGEESEESIDSPPLPLPVGPASADHQLEPAHTVESWEELIEETRCKYPWRLTVLETPLYPRQYYYPPEYRVLLPPQAAVWSPPSHTAETVIRSPPTTGPPAVHITAPPQTPSAPPAPAPEPEFEPEPMEVDPPGAQLSVPTFAVPTSSFAFAFAAPTTALPPPPPPTLPPPPPPLPLVVLGTHAPAL
ncbi:hypothetical protein TWF481_009889 [Arthrobotrys musiformis]|uniref:Uncharacterized protein n=1 Tax=Arthrobotrys musiformis TaxID=47236 RepID=A0AAV9W553_9PEZI